MFTRIACFLFVCFVGKVKAIFWESILLSIKIEPQWSAVREYHAHC